MGYTVGKLAKRFGLSRSTLLYYERAGLLIPSERSKADYRLYSEEDARRLERICRFRDAGVPIKDIAAILSDTASSITDILEARLRDLGEEKKRLDFQQEVITRLIGSRQVLKQANIQDGASWRETLLASGLSEDAIRRWHAAFSASDHEGYLAFLKAVGLPPDEGELFETFSSAPHRVKRLNLMTKRFMEIFLETLTPLPLQTPGGREHTLRALSLVQELPKAPVIADIGCGHGEAALLLAKETGGHISALDNHPPFIDMLTNKVNEQGLNERITPILGDMTDLPFETESLDCIWCEGSIFIIGFDKALKQWRPLLKDGGYYCLSELVWLNDKRPQALNDYWKDVYSDMRTVRELRQAFTDNGFSVVGSFTLPASAWNAYYEPFKIRLQAQREKYEGDAEALAVLENFRAEIETYEKYGEYYGYEFFVTRKAD